MLESLFYKLQAFRPAILLKRLQHRCFPANIAKFSGTTILENICERLFLSTAVLPYYLIVIPSTTLPDNTLYGFTYLQRNFAIVISELPNDEICICLSNILFVKRTKSLNVKSCLWDFFGTVWSLENCRLYIGGHSHNLWNYKFYK